MKVAALIAAAGASSRFGRPKALLPYDGPQTFLERILRVLDAAGTHSVTVTTPGQLMPPELLRALSRVPDHGRRIVTENRYPQQALSGSVRTALEHALDAEALLVWPIDCPFADAGLVQSLMVCVARGRAAAVPVVDGLRGHPVVFGKETFELLERADELGGPRAVLETLGDDVVAVPWSDPRVAHDVDTLDDYRNLFGREPG